MKKTIMVLIALGSMNAFANKIDLTDINPRFDITRDSIKELIGKKDTLQISCRISDTTKTFNDRQLSEAISETTKDVTSKVTSKVTAQVTKDVTASVTSKVSKEVEERLLKQHTLEAKEALKTPELISKAFEELKKKPEIIEKVKEELVEQHTAEAKAEAVSRLASTYPYSNSLKETSLKKLLDYYTLDIAFIKDQFFVPKRDYDFDCDNWTLTIRVKENISVKATKKLTGFTPADDYWSDLTNSQKIELIVEEKWRSHDDNIGKCDDLHIQPVKKKFKEVGI